MYGGAQWRISRWERLPSRTSGLLITRITLYARRHRVTPSVNELLASPAPAPTVSRQSPSTRNDRHVTRSVCLSVCPSVYLFVCVFVGHWIAQKVVNGFFFVEGLIMAQGGTGNILAANQSFVDSGSIFRIIYHQERWGINRQCAAYLIELLTNFDETVCRVGDRVQTPGYVPKKTRWVFWVHPPKNPPPKKPTLLL